MRREHPQQDHQGFLIQSINHELCDDQVSLNKFKIKALVFFFDFLVNMTYLDILAD